jgi:hypothetical protein
VPYNLYMGEGWDRPTCQLSRRNPFTTCSGEQMLMHTSIEVIADMVDIVCTLSSDLSFVGVLIEYCHFY